MPLVFRDGEGSGSSGVRSGFRFFDGSGSARVRFCFFDGSGSSLGRADGESLPASGDLDDLLGLGVSVSSSVGVGDVGGFDRLLAGALAGPLDGEGASAVGVATPAPAPPVGH